MAWRILREALEAEDIREIGGGVYLRKSNKIRDNLTIHLRQVFSPSYDGGK